MNTYYFDIIATLPVLNEKQNHKNLKILDTYIMVLIQWRSQNYEMGGSIN